MNADKELLQLVTDIFAKCLDHKLKIRTAESCTGGMLAAYFTYMPGSSKFFDRGVVVYSNQAKEDLPEVPAEILKEYGPVSSETASHMVEHIAGPKIISVATTGILGPESDETNKPVGLVFVAIKIGNLPANIHKFNFSGTRDQIRLQAVNAALQQILDNINSRFL